MALPAYTKITKNGVEYLSGLDRTQYTIKELSRAALRDVGKFVIKRAKALIPRKSGSARRWVQYWVRGNQRYPDLQVGYKVPIKGANADSKLTRGFWSMFFENGANGVKKTAPLYSAVYDNISEIRKIEGQYLSAIDDENKVLGLIDENEEESDVD